jgi:RNA polymerase sigma factor (sigma-70 family)
MVPAFIFRLRARKAMKPVMSILILVVLIAMLPSLISSTITMITGADPTVVIADLYTEERMTAMMSGDLEATTIASDEIMRREEIITIRNAVNSLEERDRQIIVLRYGLDGHDEMTQKDVADHLGISQSYISRLEKRIIAQLREALDGKI